MRIKILRLQKYASVKVSLHLLFLLFLLATAGASLQLARAQTPIQGDQPLVESARDVFSTWLQSQREALSRVNAFSARADVAHIVQTPDGERKAEYGFLFDRSSTEREGSGDMVYFLVDGDSLDVSERKRVDRVLSNMMSPEMGPMLNSLMLPARLISRARMIGEPELVEIDGRQLFRYRFLMAPPEGRDGGLRRPPLGAPRSPAAGPPGGRRRNPGLRGPERPFDRAPAAQLALFIDPELNELVMTRMMINLPNERQLVAETKYSRLQGVDIPLQRTVRGAIPFQRRLRTVTVNLNHTMQISDVTISLDTD